MKFLVNYLSLSICDAVTDLQFIAEVKEHVERTSTENVTKPNRTANRECKSSSALIKQDTLCRAGNIICCPHLILRVSLIIGKYLEGFEVHVIMPVN